MATQAITNTSIGVKFDSTGLTNSLSKVDTAMKTLNSYIKSGTSGFEAMGNTSEALKTKISGLTEKMDLQKQKIAILKTSLDESIASKGTDAKETQNLAQKYNNSVTALNKMQSELNKTNEELKNHGDSTDEAGKKTSVFGDVLKANLASGVITAGLKSIVSGIKSVGNIVVGVVSDSVKAYSEYEQLVGGVDTLFKDSSSKVQEYATTAYKTAGMSANQYMETVTSFSASLLQGLKGDTSKASDVANQAVIDMSDNANKMGTDISLIQNAYQGFAKDNYTMLDNLKLGYGGTASEMARLVNDSGVMGKSFKATAENVKNIPFDKLIESIHKTQDAMGITGTTSKEASETITGSLNSVKSSWDNIMASMASGDNKQLTSAIDGIIESIGNLATNVVKILPNIANGLTKVIQGLITQLPNIVTTLLPTVISAVSKLVSSVINILPDLIPIIIDLLLQIVNIIIENLPTIIEAGITILLALIQGLTETIPTLIPLIIDTVLLIANTILDNLDVIIIAAIDLILALALGLIDALPKLIEKIPEIITKIVLALTEPTMLAKLLSAGVTLIISLVGGLIAAIPELIAVGPRLVINLFNGIKDKILNTDWLQLGKDMVKGILKGILSIDDLIVKTANSLKDKIVGSVKSLFGIHSPSTVFADEVGKFIPEGIAVGIEANTDSVANSLDSVKDMAVNMGLQYQYGLGAVSNSKASTTTTYNSPITINIGSFDNSRSQNVKEFAEELEFYRKQKTIAKGGVA